MTFPNVIELFRESKESVELLVSINEFYTIIKVKQKIARYEYECEIEKEDIPGFSTLYLTIRFPNTILWIRFRNGKIDNLINHSGWVVLPENIFEICNDALKDKIQANIKQIEEKIS